MSRHEKLVAKFCKTPPPKDFSWDELVLLLCRLNFELNQSGGGSHCFFVHIDNPELVIHTYRPHPNGILYQKQIKDIVEFLERLELLK